MAEDIESALRQFTGQIEGIKSTVIGLQGLMTDTRQDARRASDTAQTLTAKLEAQDVPAKIAELRAEVQANAVAARSDLINVQSRSDQKLEKIDARINDASEELGSRIDGIHTRVSALEDVHKSNIGLKNFGKMMAGNIPALVGWITALLIGAAGLFGVNIKVKL